MREKVWKKRGVYNSLAEREKYMFKDFIGKKTKSYNYMIKDMDKAVDIIYKHLDKKIRVVGDYDVDGITSMSGLKLGLNALYAKDIDFYTPKRESDGYGISMNIIEKFLPKLQESESGLLITVDNGIAAIDAINYAKELGWKILILDHHLPVKKIDPETKQESILLPNADVIIDPHIKDDADFSDYCGSGLVFKLFQNILETASDESLMAKLNSFAMLGTIGDSVKLIEERPDGTFSYDNYIIVKEGLNTILQNDGRTVGLYCLLRLLQMEYSVSVTDIMYTVCPTINAIGRLNDNGASKSFELLSSEKGFNECDALAEELKDANKDRKDMTRELLPILKERIESSGNQDDYLIIVCGKPGEIHPGLLGLIAGNITENYKAMSIILTPSEEGFYKGSARAPEGSNIKDVLDKCKDLLCKYGGHAAAAGLSLRTENIKSFCDKAKLLAGEKPDSLFDVFYDFELNLQDIEEEAKLVEQYAPFGVGHPAPVYKINYNLDMKRGMQYQILGAEKKVIKLFNRYADAINFSGEGLEKFNKLNNPEKLIVYGTIGKNTYNGKTSPQILFTDLESI